MVINSGNSPGCAGVPLTILAVGSLAEAIFMLLKDKSAAATQSAALFFRVTLLSPE